MKKKQVVKIAFLASLGFISMNSFSQNTLNVTGNSAQINGMTFDYSIGEMTIISTERTSNLIVTQGLLQPFGSGSGTNDNVSSNTFSDLINEIKVYPNPTENMLFIESNETIEGEFSYQLMDATGRVVLQEKNSQKVGNNKFSLNLEALASGNYFLLVKKPNPTGIIDTYSFKIQKQN